MDKSNIVTINGENLLIFSRNRAGFELTNDDAMVKSNTGVEVSNFYIRGVVNIPLKRKVKYLILLWKYMKNN